MNDFPTSPEEVARVRFLTDAFNPDVLKALSPDSLRAMAFIADIAQQAEGVSHELGSEIRILRNCLMGWADMLKQPQWSYSGIEQVVQKVDEEAELALQHAAAHQADQDSQGF
jgi:hypothetical protein